VKDYGEAGAERGAGGCGAAIERRAELEKVLSAERLFCSVNITKCIWFVFSAIAELIFCYYGSLWL